MTALTDRRKALLAVGVYLFASLAWMIVVGVITAVGLMGWMAITGADANALLASPNPAAELPTWLVAMSTLVQFVGMFAIAAGEVWVLGWAPRDAFAAIRPPAIGLAAGLIGGLFVGLLPGWIAERLMDYFPALDGGNLEMINGLLTAGPLVGRILMIVAVCVGAPLVEELVFRGFLFDAMRRATTPTFAWLATSVMFAAYHVDPIHVVSVLFTGFFLGWLRLSTGSVWPGVAAHAVNNSLATAMAVAFGAGTATEASMPGWGAFVAAGITVAIAAIARAGTQRAG
jgi:membrane protease YdiL (CAAX protease family)